MTGGSSKQQKAQQKALEKQKQKIIEDKTFGLKNKKSKSVQKYIKSLQQQITGQPPKDSDKYIAQQQKEKEEKNKLLQQKALIASLFKTTENVKKANQDSQQKLYEPKQSKLEQKIDIYCDQRDQRAREDDMSNWDLNTLEGVIKEKQTNSCTTDIICKYFLDAVESKKYGWFWVCPNGGDECKYRHCLPPALCNWRCFNHGCVSSPLNHCGRDMHSITTQPRITSPSGFVLKSDVPKEIEENEETLEEMIERQRMELSPDGEMVTAESFARWRAAKEEMRLEKLKGKISKDSSEQLTGKDLFTFNPNLFMDDEGAADDLDYDEDINIDEIIKENQDMLEAANSINGTEDLDEMVLNKLSL